MLKPKDYAAALYRALRGKEKKDITTGVARFVESLKVRGAVRLLPRVLEALPAAARLADADRRVTIESARELSAGDIKKVLSAIGADHESTDVETKLDADLIGGVKIRKHDGTIDATVKGKLAKLKEALIRAQ